MIDLCFKFIYDQIFTLKLIKESCKEKNNVAEEIIDGLILSPVSKIFNLLRKTILNIIILIVCLFVFKIKLFSYDSIILIIITTLNDLISRYVIYYRHICEEKKDFF